MSEKLVLIDGNSILNRAFYGVPDLTNSKGLHTNAVYGFLNILFKILEEEKTDYLMVAFDVKAPTFRHEFYEDISREADQQPNGTYLFLIKKSETLSYEGCMEIMDSEFDLHYVDIHDGIANYHVDFD